MACCVIALTLSDHAFGQDHLLSKYYPEVPLGDTLLVNQYYSVAYNRHADLPHWGTYMITPTRLENRLPNRSTRSFRSDPRVSGNGYKRYSGNDFDMAHLVPLKAMDFDESAAQVCMLTSNCSPQYSRLNRGVWHRLENHEFRRGRKDTLVVISGHGREFDLVRGVPVPRKYFKVLLNPKEKEVSGFLVPNLPDEESYVEDLDAYRVSIRDIENYIGYALFPALTRKEYAELLNSELRYWERSGHGNGVARIQALVVGNDNYALNYLEGSIDDASAVGEAVKELGGEVRYGFNVSGDSLRQLIEAFYLQSDEFDWSIFYFAGHGIQENQGMTMLGVDSESPDGEVQLDYLLSPFAKRTDKSSPQGVVFIDACRVGSGLIGAEQPQNVKVQFATQQGAQALDAPALGIYAGTLSKLLVRNKGLPIDALLTNIAVHVYEETFQHQLPTSCHGVLISQKSLMEPNPYRKQ